MAMNNPVHPGAIVREECLLPLRLSVTEGAKRLGVGRQTLSNLVNEKASISIRNGLPAVESVRFNARDVARHANGLRSRALPPPRKDAQDRPHWRRLTPLSGWQDQTDSVGKRARTWRRKFSVRFCCQVISSPGRKHATTYRRSGQAKRQINVWHRIFLAMWICIFVTYQRSSGTGRTTSSVRGRSR